MRVSFNVKVLTEDYEIYDLEPGVYWSEDTAFDDPGLIVVDKFGDNTFIHEKDLEGLTRMQEASPVIVSEEALKNSTVNLGIAAKQDETPSAPCALLDPDFVLKALAVVANPELAKELTK